MLDELGTATMIYFAERYELTAPATVYWPRTQENDGSASVLRAFYTCCQGILRLWFSYWAETVEKECDERLFNLYVQSGAHRLFEDSGILLNSLLSNNSTEPARKKQKIGNNKVDALRTRFAQLLRQKYSTESYRHILILDDFLLSLGRDPIKNKCLPNHFFTKYLENQGFKLCGGEGITDLKQIRHDHLERLVKGLEEGSVKFIETELFIFRNSRGQAG